MGWMLGRDANQGAEQRLEHQRSPEGTCDVGEQAGQRDSFDLGSLLAPERMGRGVDRCDGAGGLLPAAGGHGREGGRRRHGAG